MISRKGIRSLVSAGLAVLAAFPSAGFANVELFDWAVNIDGSFVDYQKGGDPAAVAGVNAGGFDSTQGLGTIFVTVNGTGLHSIDAFFDHQFDALDNTYFNETASVSGAAAAQSWEIDEPSFVNGDILDNIQDSMLDNAIGASIYGNTTFPDDVSMAMGWDFVLGVDQTALITLLISDTLLATTDLVLIHSDPDSEESIYFTGDLEIRTASVPAPPTMALLCLGLALTTVSRLRNRAPCDR